MRQTSSNAGRVSTRPALFVADVAALGMAGVVLLSGSEHPDRASAVIANPGFTAPVESLVGGVRHIYHTSAPEALVLDSIFPDRPVDLLWFQGLATSRTVGGEAVVLDGGGGAVRFDGRLAPHRIRLRLEGREPVSIAVARTGGYWIVDTDGTVLRVDASGEIAGMTESGFDFAAAVADPQGGAWLVRSTQLFSFRLATADDPILVRVNDDGRVTDSLGSAVLPGHILLAEIANAGHVVVTDDVIFYAPFIRDEVIALSRDGDTLWVAHRGLPQSTDDPRFEIGPDGPMIDYAPVNLGAALGPDGRLYVFSVPGFTASESRLDVFDQETGALLRSTLIDEPLPTLAADDGGRVYRIDPFRLLTGVAPKERERFTAFDLEKLAGGRMTLDHLRGKVVLINFWASWCAPCREEMPALDSLRRSIDDPDFLFVTMNEDVKVSEARAFIDEFGFDFPVLLGKGKLRQRYHYYGLPFTVLIDREGRTVQRWIGFAGEEQIAGIRAVIQAELLRGPGGSEVARHEGHQEHEVAGDTMSGVGMTHREHDGGQSY